MLVITVKISLKWYKFCFQIVREHSRLLSSLKLCTHIFRRHEVVVRWAQTTSHFCREQYFCRIQRMSREANVRQEFKCEKKASQCFFYGHCVCTSPWVVVFTALRMLACLPTFCGVSCPLAVDYWFPRS